MRRAPTNAVMTVLMAAVLTAGAVAGHAQAGDTVAHVVHVVQTGESLYRIAQEQLEDPARWPEVARLNRLARPSKLQPGQRLLLPLALMKGQASQATVAYVRGGVLADGAALRIGDRIEEAATLTVPSQGFISVTLADGSLLQLQSDSTARLVRLRDLPRETRNTLIQLDRGRIDLRVSPQTPGSRFRVKTPLATAGVRGTRFGVTMAADGALTATDVIEGLVAVGAVAAVGAAPPGAAEAEVSIGQGAVVRPGRALALRPLPPAPPWTEELRLEQLPGVLPMGDVRDGQQVRVEIAEDDDFTRVVATLQGRPPLTVPALPDGHYRIRGRLLDAEGLFGLESASRVRVKTLPHAPIARAPSEGQVVPPAPVVFRCTEVPGAQGYLFQVAEEPGFERLLAERQVPPDACTFTLGPVPTGTLYWRVASLAPEPDGRLERGPFSDRSRLEIRPLPVAPAGDDLSLQGDRLHWAGAAGSRYRVQVAADAAFEQVLSDVDVDVPEARLTLPTGCRTLAVRLQAIDALGRRSDFGAPRLISGDAGLCTEDGAAVEGGGVGVRVER